MSNEELKYFYDKAAVLCSRSEKCKDDLYRKLEKWGATESISIRVVEMLVDEKYIDEERFAFCYVRDKFRFNSWGKTKIRFHLRHKQIPSNSIETALKSISDSDYRETLKELVEKKASSIKYSNEYEKRSKLMRFAAGRGFEMDLIMQLLNA